MRNNSYVLDTNIWVSSIISNSFSELEKFIILKNLKVCICPEMILELEDVLKRPKFKKYLTDSVSNYIFGIQKITILKFIEKSIMVLRIKTIIICMTFVSIQIAF